MESDFPNVPIAFEAVTYRRIFLVKSVHPSISERNHTQTKFVTTKTTSVTDCVLYKPDIILGSKTKKDSVKYRLLS